jgi:hypothetical protein
MLSIIVPAGAQERHPLLIQSLLPFEEHPEIEIIYVGFTESALRAQRLNIGVARASGSMLLLHHPRSCIDPAGIEYLLSHQNRAFWGGFTQRFDWDHPLLRFTSWYSNRVRVQHRGIIYLDHCIFLHRSLWQNEIPFVDIFEDTILSQQLRSLLRPELLPFSSITSAIRFQRNGVYRQALLNQLLKLGFFLQLPAPWMNKIYEKGLDLNGATGGFVKNSTPRN